ncbi:hypothetical protein [Flavobacterium sp. LC2016-12]|uniref:hypothetical protein n=1 Tax=Flavobacterium sp. LC2016-12 TaxID=2783794 RepID=UPI00188B4FD4|nr:hypothetical protein [Flavobacterium sp. LC2016-12]MBF4465149.1 hypothetical protein [Flavobacterium sp. LC2016-12]
MKTINLEFSLKAIWIVFILITIYIFSWITFLNFTFGNIVTTKYTIWNLIIPNIFTLGILIIYTKEILMGYNPKSKSRNLKSFVFFTILILILTLIQIPQFEIIFDENNSKYWQIVLSLIIVLTSYFGIILNRVLKIKGLKN